MKVVVVFSKNCPVIIIKVVTIAKKQKPNKIAIARILEGEGVKFVSASPKPKSNLNNLTKKYAVQIH